MADNHDTTIPREDGKERLVYICADGSWVEPADGAGQVENLPGRDQAVLRGLLAEALRNAGVETIPTSFPVADSARVDKLISTLQNHLHKTSDLLGDAIRRGRPS